MNHAASSTDKLVSPALRNTQKPRRISSRRGAAVIDSDWLRHVVIIGRVSVHLSRVPRKILTGKGTTSSLPEPSRTLELVQLTATNPCSTVEERRFQRRVKRSWRNQALAPVVFHPTGTPDSPTKTHTLPHPAPTARARDSTGRTRNASHNPPRLESDDS